MAKARDKAQKADPKDPRFRTFRMAAYGVYLVVVGAFSLMIIVGVFRSVVAMSPKTPPDSDQVLTERECVDALDRMWKRLENERRGFVDVAPSQQVDARFTRFRMQWVKDLRELEGKCATDSRDRKQLAQSFDRLERLLDLYMTHAVQFAGEVGPAVDDFRTSMDASRKKAAGR